MSTVRCVVKVDGEIVHDETYVNEHRLVQEVAYPGLKVHGQKVEVGFEFDPPLQVPIGD